MNRLLKKKMIPLVKDFWNTMSKGMLVLMLLLVWGASGVSGANGAVGDTFEYQNCTYKITDLNEIGYHPYCELTSSKVPNTEPLVVPDYAYNSETGKMCMVTSIAGGSCKSYQGPKVVIGNNVRTIGDKAFEHFGEHKAVTLILGTKITSMNNKAFEHLGESGNCKVFITSTTLPKNIKIDHQTFEHVKNTTFYLANEYLYTQYKADSNWKEYDAANNNKGNSYLYPFPYEYEARTKGWKTFIGPEDMDNYYIESIFGQGTKVAYLKEAHWISETATYNLVFAETTTIKANTPYFINPTNDDIAYITEAELKVSDNNCTSVAVQNKDNYYAQMIGNASKEDYHLKANEFYFRNYNGLYFYVAGEDSKSFVSPSKCHFRITEGNSNTPVLAKVAMFMDFDDSTTGITETEVKTQTAKGIYDIHGMYRGNNLQNLPKGLYIVNGKKIIK